MTLSLTVTVCINNESDGIEYFADHLAVGSSVLRESCCCFAANLHLDLVNMFSVIDSYSWFATLDSVVFSENEVIVFAPTKTRA